MNKTDLTAHLKQGADSIDKILEAAQLPLDLQEYSPEQIKVTEEITQLVSSKQAKTYKDAGVLYRKPLDEAQLQEIAARHSQTDRIPEIVTSLKLKPGNITNEQLEQFREVCEQVQQGIELPIVAQGVLNKAKAARAKKSATLPEFAPQTEPEQSNGSAIAKASEASLSETFEQFENAAPGAAQSVSGLVVEQLEDRSAAELANTVTEGLTVLPKALAQQVQRQMFDAVGTEQFSINVVAKVQRLLKERGFL
jgi:hypothetical protein